MQLQIAKDNKLLDYLTIQGQIKKANIVKERLQIINEEISE